MKILLTTDNIGGVWTYCLELASALGAKNVEVALATMGTPLTKKQCEEVRKIPYLTVHESSYKLEWMEDPWDDVDRAGQWLLRLEEEIHPDIIHLNSYVHASLPWSTPTLVVGHSCVLSWLLAVKNEIAPPSWDRYRDRVTRGLRSADYVVAPTRAMMNFLNQFYGPLTNTSVILNGRDSSLFRPKRKEPFVFSAGRLWDEAKNISTLDIAAERLPWPVYVAGDAQHPCGQTVEHHHIRFVGRFSPPQIADWFGRASIFALPARYEPFGLSILEAAFSGCALVLGDIPSLREIWNDSALFVPPNDVDALHWAIKMLVRDDICRRIYSDRAYIRARDFSPHRMAMEYLNLYQKLIAQSHFHEVQTI